jgi:sugar lactone lactonase YvrE
MAPSLSNLVPDQEPEVVATGFQFTEGPLWHPDGYLLFSDIPTDTIHRWSASAGIQVFLTPSANSNGLTFDGQGRLVACEHGGRRVSRMGTEGAMEPAADLYQGKRLNSPNDVVVHSSGAIYFTDPPYGILPDLGEQGFNGVYRLNTNGSLDLLVSDFVRPNGLAFSPDESTLYVDDSHRRQTWAFGLRPDGWLSNGRLFVDQDVEPLGSPDGMKVDVEGNLYITGGGGLWVVDPAGRHLGTIPFPELPANLAFGDDDLRSIYVTARTSIYRLRINVPGIRVL